MKKKTVVTMILTATMISGLFAGCGTKESVETTAPVSKIEKVSNDAEKAVKKTITISVTADKGWDKDSTPAIAHIKSKDKDADIDFYHAVKAGEKGGKGSSTVELAEGAYTVEFVSPLNKDGSAYEIYDTGKAQEITVGSGEEVEIECPMTQIPADKVTDEMVKDIINKTQDAVENGDETLKGGAGKDVLDKLDKNAGNNPNVSEETKKEAENVKEKTDTESKPAETAKTDTKADTKKTETAGNAQSSSTAQSGGNNSTSKPAGTKPAESKPAHTHAWKEHTATKTEWVPNIVTVPDYGTQQVVVGSAWHCNCGAVIQGDTSNHVMNHILNGEPDNGYDAPIYENQTVQVGSHTEDHGSNVTTSYVDYYYCDCGARK